MRIDIINIKLYLTFGTESQALQIQPAGRRLLQWVDEEDCSQDTLLFGVL